jgi:hypothetical protein
VLPFFKTQSTANIQIDPHLAQIEMASFFLAFSARKKIKWIAGIRTAEKARTIRSHKVSRMHVLISPFLVKISSYLGINFRLIFMRLFILLMPLLLTLSLKLYLILPLQLLLVLLFLLVGKFSRKPYLCTLKIKIYATFGTRNNQTRKASGFA